MISDAELPVTNAQQIILGNNLQVHIV